MDFFILLLLLQEEELLKDHRDLAVGVLVRVKPTAMADLEECCGQWSYSEPTLHK